MILFMKILGLIIGLGFIFFAVQFFFFGKRIISWVQNQKYHKICEPRHSEIIFSKAIGVLLFLIGSYYTFVAILSFFS